MPEVLAAPAGHAVFVQFVDSRVIDKDFAGRRAVDAGDHIQQRGLAAARFADDADEFTSLDMQVYVFERGEISNGGFVILDHVAQFDDGMVPVGTSTSFSILRS
jgi:hypothetical protein